MKENILTARYFKLLLPLSISLITFLLYLPALNNGFVNWDDNLGIVENTYIRHLDYNLIRWAFTDISTQKEYWKPLVNLSHALDYAIWGLNPWGHHLVNILFHVLNVLLVFSLSRMLLEVGWKDYEGRNKRVLIVAGTSAFLFAVHPLNVESVAWVTERKDMLSGFFFLLTLIFYLKYVLEDSKIRSFSFYSFSIIAYSMAILSKPMVVSLPLVLLILDYYPLKRICFKKDYHRLMGLALEKVPFIVLCLTVIIITVVGQSERGSIDSTVPLLYRYFFALYALSFYLIKIFFPFNLAPFYAGIHSDYIKTVDFWLFTMPFFLFFLAVLASGKRRHFILSIFLFFIVTLFPVLGIVKSGNQMAADRFTYIPAIAIFFMIGVGIVFLLEKLQKRTASRLYLVLFIVIVTLLSAKVVRQIPVWKDSTSLWTHELKIYPYPSAHPIVHLNRGTVLLNQGQSTEAIIDLDRAINLARMKNIDVKPFFFVEAFYNRGTAKAMTGLLREALNDFNEAILLDSNFARAYNNRGQVYLLLRMYDKALQDYSRAIELNPMIGQAYYNRGLIYIKKGDRGKASENFVRAAELGIIPARRFLPER